MAFWTSHISLLSQSNTCKRYQRYPAILELVVTFGAFQNAFHRRNKNRWDELKDKKKGPKCKSKRTEKLAKRALAIRFKSPEKDMYEITDILTEDGYNISARSVARVLSEHGVT